MATTEKKDEEFKALREARMQEMIDRVHPTMIDFGFQLRELLPQLNSPLNAGQMTRQQWNKFIEKFTEIWQMYSNLTGYTVDDATRAHITLFLKDRA